MDLTLEQIARWMRLKVPTVRAFDQLFFNVRDRRDEPGYITQLLHPDGIGVGRDYVSEELLLLRVGALFGAQEVIRVARIKPDTRVQSLDELRENLERELLLAAETRALHGGDQDLDSPVVTTAMKVLVAEKRTKRDQPKQGGDVNALEEISAHYSVMETLKQVSEPDIKKMIALDSAGSEDTSKRRDPEWFAH